MNISGTIQRRGSEFFLSTSEGEYKIHFSEKERLDLGDEAVGLQASAEDEPDIHPLSKFPGWVKNGSLVID